VIGLIPAGWLEWTAFGLYVTVGLPVGFWFFFEVMSRPAGQRRAVKPWWYRLDHKPTVSAVLW
jgi:hypothetical protein